MRAVVFSGPSLPPSAAPPMPSIEWRPPARQGDVHRAALARAEFIGIVDGYFEVTPTIWHKEILWAMAQGIHVVGAASIGALRAAELHPFGMEGVGRIYEMYRDGVLCDDDEIAVLHGPEELGFTNLTEPMVNVRATLERAVEQRVLEPATATALVRIGKSLFYKRRTFERLFEVGVLTGLDPIALRKLSESLSELKVDQKRLDAEAMLGLLQERVRRPVAPFRARYHFACTEAWHEAARHLGLQNGRA